MDFNTLHYHVAGPVLLDPGEHTSCIRYMGREDTGFRHLVLGRGQRATLRPDPANHLLIALEGSLEVCVTGLETTVLEQGYMTLVPIRRDCSVRALAPAGALDMSFINPQIRCDRMFLSSCAPLRRDAWRAPAALPLRYPLDVFARVLTDCLDAGLGCTHFHMLKQQELFFYLKCFYSAQEVADLFHPALEGEEDFIGFVCSNARATSSVEELARGAGMSRSTFQRRFRQAFGQTASSWLKALMCREIIAAVADPALTVKDLAYDFGFSSPESFSRFCKDNFGCRPGDLLSRVRQRGVTDFDITSTGRDGERADF